MSNEKKVRNSNSTLMRLIGYLAPRCNRIFVVLVATILSTVFTVLGPKVMGDTITIVFNGAYAKLTGTGEGIDYGKVGGMLGQLAGLYILGSLLTFMMEYLMASVAQNTVYDVRTDSFNKLKKLSLKYYDIHSHGDTMRRGTNDLD